MQQAYRVLRDCKHAVALLEETTNPDTFRVLWVAAIALARAVGHVLENVNQNENPGLSAAIRSAYEEWKADKPKNSIYWDFIREERNRTLKEYEICAADHPTILAANGQAFSVDLDLYSPLSDGPFAGEDCRDILHEAVAWWEKELGKIEKSAKDTKKPKSI